MVENQKRTFSDYISEATLIAIATAIAYSVAFLYEAGYLSTFNIPLNLIQIQLDTVLIILITLSAATWTLFNLINFMALTWPKSWVLQDKMFRICLILIFPVWRLILYGWQSSDWFLYFFPLLVIIIFELLWPIFVFHKKKTLKEKFEADEIAEVIPRSKTIFGRLSSLFGPIGYASIILFLLLSKMSYDAGKAKALTQDKYFILGDTSNTIVVRFYKDILICVTLDKYFKKINSNVILKKISDKPIKLLLKDIGPLDFKFDEKSNVIENNLKIENTVKDSLNN